MCPFPVRPSDVHNNYACSADTCYTHGAADHFLKRYFLFVSWPSLQIPFLLGKPSLYPFPAPFLGKGVKRGEKEGIQEPLLWLQIIS